MNDDLKPNDLDKHSSGKVCPREGVHHFVFWRYDHFPYVLGAPAVLLQDGSYEVKSYKMKVTKPLAIYEPATGKAINDSLTRLRRERDMAMAVLHEGFLARLKEILPMAYPASKP
jgi:hypothetical protein